MLGALAIMIGAIINVFVGSPVGMAVIATLAIVVWHFYNVHFNPSRFPGTLLWWHGKISLKEMKEEHPIEYERMMRERAAEENKQP